MKLSDAEARHLVNLRLEGMTHRQAMAQIRAARNPSRDPTPAQKEHRRRAAAALLISQRTGCSLSEAWQKIMSGHYTTSEKRCPNNVGDSQKGVGE